VEDTQETQEAKKTSTERNSS